MGTLTNKLNEKTWFWVIGIISIAVVGVVAFLIHQSQNISAADTSIYILPKLNAVINSITFILLLTGYYFIRQKKILIHRTIMLSAFVFSSIFLVLYIIYHYSAPETKFGGEGPVRIIYFFLLISHILLAISIIPLAFITLFRGLNLDFRKHKKIARITLPIWLYVSLTGVIVYLLIAPYYPA